MDTRRLVGEERKDLVAFLHTLSDDEWDAPSLCVGWRVRDVVGHLLYDTISMPRYLAIAARCRSADKVNAYIVEKSRSLTTRMLLDKFETSIGHGPFALVLPSMTLADTVIHHQDIRRPLHRPRAIPAERLVAVLDRPDPFAHPRHRSRGLRFLASDVDWSRGEGPEVRGPGEAIALAVAGRGAALKDLAGDGVAVLRDRIGGPSR